MESTISQEMAKELLSIVQGTKNFVLEQAPDVAQQIINYSFYSHLAGVVFFFLLFVSAVIVAYKTKKLNDSSRRYENDGTVIAGMIYSGAAGLIGFVATLINFNLLLKVYFAPKIYLIEYLSQLVK